MHSSTSRQKDKKMLNSFSFPLSYPRCQAAAWCLPSVLWNLVRTDGAGMSPTQRCVISVWVSFHPIDLQISLDGGTSGRREREGNGRIWKLSHMLIKGLVTKIMLVKLSKLQVIRSCLLGQHEHTFKTLRGNFKRLSRCKFYVKCNQ